MQDQLLYIKSHIVGVWDNERFSINVNPETQSGIATLSITAKDYNPYTGNSYLYLIVKDNGEIILRMIDSINMKKFAIDYKITIDKVNNTMELSTDGAKWIFIKVA